MTMTSVSENRLHCERGNESMQTVMIMAVGALILLGVNRLYRQISPKIQQYVQAVVSGEQFDQGGSVERFVFGGNQQNGPQPDPASLQNNRIPMGPPISMRELTRQASAMAYTGKPGDRTSDGQWMIREDGLVEDHTGFRAIILTSADGSDTGAIIAFAGTDLKNTNEHAINDLANDLEQGISGVSPQYVRAIRLAEALKDRYNGNIFLTGHSLGGGLASLASAVNQVPGSAFNSAPLGGAAAITSAISEYGSPSNFMNYRNENDPISHLPGYQFGHGVELSGDYGSPGWDLSDHDLENMREVNK